MNSSGPPDSKPQMGDALVRIFEIVRSELNAVKEEEGVSGFALTLVLVQSLYAVGRVGDVILEAVTPALSDAERSETSNTLRAEIEPFVARTVAWLAGE